MGNLIKADLALLGKRQLDLLEEIHKRGYPNIDQCQLSSYLRGVSSAPQPTAIRALSREIVDEWKCEMKVR